MRTVMAKEQLSYQRGGYIIGAHLKGPSKSLAELVKELPRALLNFMKRRCRE
jgi:hypothetical protein